MSVSESINPPKIMSIHGTRYCSLHCNLSGGGSDGGGGVLHHTSCHFNLEQPIARSAMSCFQGEREEILKENQYNDERELLMCVCVSNSVSH